MKWLRPSCGSIPSEEEWKKYPCFYAVLCSAGRMKIAIPDYIDGNFYAWDTLEGANGIIRPHLVTAISRIEIKDIPQDIIHEVLHNRFSNNSKFKEICDILKIGPRYEGII